MVESVDTPDLKSVGHYARGSSSLPAPISTKYKVVENVMKYTLSQSYCFYLGQVVRMYFIQGLPYTFDELPQIVQDHPAIQTEALSHRDYDDEELYQTSNYLIMEEMHPLMFPIEVDNPELLPVDD